MAALGDYKIGDTTKSGEAVKILHGQTVDVVVFEDANGRTNWETKIDPPPAREVKVHNLFDRLHTRAGLISDKKLQDSIINELARALFRALCEYDESTALAHFSEVEQRITQQALIRARVVHAAAGCCAALVVVLAAVVGHVLIADSSMQALILGAGLGAAGAWVSVVQRSWKLVLMPFESASYLAFQGTTRIALGTLFGGFVVLAVKAGLVFAPLASTIWGIAALSFAGGASERLVPELLRGAEDANLLKALSRQA